MQTRWKSIVTRRREVAMKDRERWQRRPQNAFILTTEVTHGTTDMDLLRATARDCLPFDLTTRIEWRRWLSCSRRPCFALPPIKCSAHRDAWRAKPWPASIAKAQPRSAGAPRASGPTPDEWLPVSAECAHADCTEERFYFFRFSLSESGSFTRRRRGPVANCARHRIPTTRRQVACKV